MNISGVEKPQVLNWKLLEKNAVLFYFIQNALIKSGFEYFELQYVTIQRRAILVSIIFLKNINDTIMWFWKCSVGHLKAWPSHLWLDIPIEARAKQGLQLEWNAIYGWGRLSNKTNRTLIKPFNLYLYAF